MSYLKLKIKKSAEIILGSLSEKVAVCNYRWSRCIGKATAETLLKEGAKVVLVDLFQESLDKAKAELDIYGELITVQADVSKSCLVRGRKKAINPLLGVMNNKV